MATSKVSVTKFKAAVTKAKKVLSKLPAAADSIAVQLYREKVRNAKCGDAKLCAIAQYVANKMPQGVSVSVTNAFVRVIAPGHMSVTVPVTDATGDFIENFDEEQYPFLQTA